MRVQTAKTIRQCQTALGQLDHCILLEKQAERQADTSLKKNLGKLFLVAGVGEYFPEKSVAFHQVVQLGALVLIASLKFEKRNVLLGGLATTCEECKENSQYLHCEKLGEKFFEGSKKLTGTMALALGIALATKQTLHQSDSRHPFQSLGETLFAKQREGRLLKRKSFALQKLGIHVNEQDEK